MICVFSCCLCTLHQDLPPSQTEVMTPPPQNITDIFTHHHRTLDRISQLYGEAAVERVSKNISKVSLVSLFSGLGGAELLMENIFNATQKRCQENGNELPTEPRI